MLHYAVKLFLSFVGTYVNATDLNDMDVLMCVSAKRYHEVVKCILAASDIDINTINV